MRVVICAVITLAIVLAFEWRPAAAQFSGDQAVLVNMVIEVLPDSETGHCFQVEPGTLGVALQAVGNPSIGPVQYNLGISGNVDALRVFSTVHSTGEFYTIPVERGLYCYNLRNWFKAPADVIILPELRKYAQYVGMRLIWNR